jgi:hypothetical protein
MEQNLDVDEIWRALKPWGRYQVRQMCFMWAAMIPCSIHLLAVVFIGEQQGKVSFPYCSEVSSQWQYKQILLTLFDKKNDPFRRWAPNVLCMLANNRVIQVDWPNE